jgi:hypothetical protein
MWAHLLLGLASGVFLFQFPTNKYFSFQGSLKASKPLWYFIKCDLSAAHLNLTLQDLPLSAVCHSLFNMYSTMGTQLISTCRLKKSNPSPRFKPTTCTCI